MPAGAARHARLEGVIPVLGAGARGLAIGALVATLGAASYAGQNLRFLGAIGDALATMLLIGLAIALVQLVLLVGTLLVGVILRLVARLVPATHRFVTEAGLPLLRRARGWLVASTLAIAAMLWLSPEAGPLAVFRSLLPFEIFVVTGAVVGTLAGLAWWAWRTVPPGSRRTAVVAGLVLPAVALGVGVLAWAVQPGFGDAIVREEPTALAVVPMLDLPDPSLRGPHEVVAASYGSGTDASRPEFGEEADWITPTIDASAALPARDAVAAMVADVAWGYDTTALPLNGLAWYPADADGPMPLVLIVHGNHIAREFSDPGYAYLGEHLASHGMIAVSVDENYLNGDALFDYGGAEFGARAWLLLRHLEEFEAWNADETHPLAGRVDLDRVAFIGHSRGGEAAALAAALEAGEDEVPGLPAVPRGFGIRAVVGIAPSDGMYKGSAAPITLTDVDYLVLQGAHDADLPAFTGLRTYHRVELTGAGDHLKVALYSQRANHGRFNTVWDTGDAGALASWMLDRGSILTADEQEHLARTVIGAFLARSLLDQTEYDAFFREPRAGRAWLPDDVVMTRWEASARVEPEIDVRRGEELGLTTSGFDAVDARDPMLRDRTVVGDRALQLSWSGPASLDVPLDPSLAATVDPAGRLTVSLSASTDGAVVDPIVTLTDADGTVASIRLSEVAPMRPLLPTRLWKLDVLGDRYMPSEKISWPAERFLQTYAIQLDRFVETDRDLDLDRLTGIGVRFEGEGDLYLDGIGFERD